MNTFGRYEVHKEIGHGAMGIVYRGSDPEINRDVALKCLRASLIERGSDAARRFQREARALGRLAHPNIVSIFDAGQDERSGQTYIVMEYVKGISLAQLLKEGRSLPLEQVVEVGIQICRGLHFAHSKGVIHRDIKPGNILLSEDLKQVKITDFGIARIDNTALTQTERLTGTPPYMSPEQCRGEHLDGRSDLFAVGALLYELLTKEKAFQGASPLGVIHQVLNHTPYPPSIVSEDVPCILSGVVMQALEKRAERRFSTGNEMADELEMSRSRTKDFYLTDAVGKTQRLEADEEPPLGQKTSALKARDLLVGSACLFIVLALFFAFRETPKRAGHALVEHKAANPPESGLKKPKKEDRAQRKPHADPKPTAPSETEKKASGNSPQGLDKKHVEPRTADPTAQHTAEEVVKSRPSASTKKMTENTAKAQAEVDIQKGQKQAKGLVYFETTPSGADILVNGDWVGLSPMSLELAAGRAHELLVQKEGYHALEATIEAPAGEETPINLTLLAEKMP